MMPMAPPVAAVGAGRHRRQTMFVRNRTELGETAVIGIRLLDLLAILDRLCGCNRSRAKASRGCGNHHARSHIHPLKVAPVLSATCVTIFAATASISASVNVRSRGCKVTAMATDFLPAGTPVPS